MSRFIVITFYSVLVLGLVMPRDADAIFITVIEDNGNFVNDFSQPSELDLDVFWLNLNSVRLEVTIEAGDTDPIAFSGVHQNVTGIPWSDFHIELAGGPIFEAINDIFPAPSQVADCEPGDTTCGLFFEPPIPHNGFVFLLLGNPNDSVDLNEDWFIALNGLGAGDTFDIHVQPSAESIPEPAGIALLGLGVLGTLGFCRRRGAS